MGKYFGTDGVRAVAGQFPLVDDFIQKLGYAALRELQEYAKSEHLKPQVIIAQDSRASGPAILAALEKGIRASGANVISVGVAPTPAVAYLVKHTGSLCGVVISASHNPAEFNGIKFFTNQGTKLPEELENSIEAEIESLEQVPAPKGTYTQQEELVQEYERFLMSTVDAALYGLIKTFVCSRLMDTVLYGLDTARVAYIITDRWREVSRALLEMRRGVTLLQGQGAYTGAEKHVLLVAFKQREVVQVKRLLREIDPAAFFIVCDAHEIFGEGFGDYQKEEI